MQYDPDLRLISNPRFHPIFLGGIMVATGNKPPGTVPAKAKYSSNDLRRTIKYFGTEKISVPPFFPFLSLLVRTILNV